MPVGISHEIGTPLNVISGHAQLIADGHAPGTEDHQNAWIVIQQTKRLAAILGPLLAFARQLTPRPPPVELGLVVSETIAALAPLAAERRITLDIDVGADALVSKVDRRRLQQALTNLVLYAFQAVGREGNVAVALIRQTAVAPRELGGKEGSFARIAVVDTGSGVPSRVPCIFEPFFRSNNVGTEIGVGLSIAHGIVNEHGGWVEVMSEFGVGSRFAIFLPLEQARSLDHRR